MASYAPMGGYAGAQSGAAYAGDSYAPLPQYAPPPPQYAPPGPSPTNGAPGDRARFDDLVARLELRPDMADDLFGVLSTTTVVLLLDDSGSMATRVADPLSAPFARGGPATRWSELEMFTVTAVDIITATSPGGVDVYFLDRPGMSGVTSAQQLAPAFATGPRGGTPIIGALSRIFRQYAALAATRRVLVVVITDGEPSDGTTRQLFNVLATQRHPNIHVSLAEMSDDEATMRFLDGWDQQLLQFDNSDDYRMEARRVRQQKGYSYKFRSGEGRGGGGWGGGGGAVCVRVFARARRTPDCPPTPPSYNDYVVKVLLGSLMRKYFMLDGGGALQMDDCCCAIA